MIYGALMGLYFQFHVVRRVPDPMKDNCFVRGAPELSGIHSSSMDMLFTKITQVNTELSAGLDWYTKAFACSGQPITQAHFFEPSDILQDLQRITAEILTRNAHLPPFYWLRVGNKSGVREAVPRCGVDIYYNGEPCSVSSGWFGASIYSSRGKLQDVTNASSVDCRLREANYGGKDEVEGTVYIEHESFFSHLRPFLFDLFTPCDWALRRRLLVLPMWH